MQSVLGEGALRSLAQARQPEGSSNAVIASVEEIPGSTAVVLHSRNVSSRGLVLHVKAVVETCH